MKARTDYKELNGQLHKQKESQYKPRQMQIDYVN
jgi:hypothetical protein